MTFKKVTQIIWILLATAFLVLLYLHTRGSNIEIYKSELHDTLTYLKIDKLTGSVELFGYASTLGWSREWKELTGRPESSEDKE